jgi:hypothetical protein
MSGLVNLLENDLLLRADELPPSPSLGLTNGPTSSIPSCGRFVVVEIGAGVKLTSAGLLFSIGLSSGGVREL